MWTRTAVAAAVIERLPGASGLPQHVVDLRAHSAFFEMTAYHDGDALGPSPAWGLKTLVTAAVLFLSLGFWLGQYYVRRLLPSRAEPAPPSQPGAGPQRTQGPVGAEPAPAPRREPGYVKCLRHVVRWQKPGEWWMRSSQTAVMGALRFLKGN